MMYTSRLGKILYMLRFVRGEESEGAKAEICKNAPRENRKKDARSGTRGESVWQDRKVEKKLLKLHNHKSNSRSWNIQRTRSVSRDIAATYRATRLRCVMTWRTLSWLSFEWLLILVVRCVNEPEAVELLSPTKQRVHTNPSTIKDNRRRAAVLSFTRSRLRGEKWNFVLFWYVVGRCSSVACRKLIWK